MIMHRYFKSLKRMDGRWNRFMTCHGESKKYREFKEDDNDYATAEK